jgi:hypothetical protein
MSVWVRRVLALACLLATWLVVRPAAASAPMCDEHGASALAPIPLLDAPDASLDTGGLTDGCEDWVPRGTAFERDGRPRVSEPKAHPHFVIPEPLGPDPNAACVLGETTGACVGERAGIRNQVERPPRLARG